MAIDPTTTTTIRVGQLGSAAFNSTDLVPHEVSGTLKKGTLQDLATFIGSIISVDVSVGFRAVQVNDGETLPATDQQEFILVGPGTYPNVGGGATITTTGALNALVSNGVFWFIGVEIPIEVSAIWGDINGVLSDQTDLNNILVAKADLIGGKVPNSQLPSYVDDVIEVNDYAALPSTGETGKIYVTKDTGNIYRWSGSAYIRIADESPVWGIINGNLPDQTDLQNALDGKFDVPIGDTTQYIAGNGSLVTFPIAGQAGTLVRLVLNNSGSTIAKGSVVYINGASGNKPTIAKAIATGDSTSAQTFGLVQTDITNNSSGYVVVSGDLIGLNTSGITEGTQLYLSSTTAGEYTTTKQYAPAHLVYVGVVTRSHATLGQIEVKIQNGYELDELHDVAISSKTNKDFLVYESSTNLWKNKSLGTVLAGTSSQFVKGDGSLDSSTYLTSLSGAVLTTTDQTVNGVKKFTDFLSTDKAYNQKIISGTYMPDAGYANIFQNDRQITFLQFNAAATAVTQFSFIYPTSNTNQFYYVPNASGTLALTSDLHSAVTIGTANGLSLSTQVLSLGLASGSANGALSSTDWTTFNNKQNAITNLIDGIVLAGYIPKSTSATSGLTTLGNSAIYDNSGKIGIGTTAPLNKLHVDNGGIRLSDATNANFRGITFGASSTDSTEYAYIKYTPSTGEMRYWANPSGFGGFTSFYSNATESMRITSSGKIGIGTTSPSALLQVSKSLTSADNTKPTLNVNSKTDGNYSGGVIDFGQDASVNKFARIAGVRNDARVDSQLEFSTNSDIYNGSDLTSIKMVIKGNGNVGIGTTSPSAKLNVSGDIHLGSYSDTSINTYEIRTNKALFSIASDGVTNGNGTLITYSWANGGGGPLKFNNASGEVMRLSSGGNVGIGTTSPSEKLSVVGGNISLGAGYKLQYSSTAYMTPENNVSGAEIATGGILTIKTGGTTERVRVDASGNVGIGTTANTYVSRLVLDGAVDNNTLECKHTGTGSVYNVIFVNGNGYVGDIRTNGSSTSFNTTSDYRLKQDFKSFNGLDLVSKIKVYDYAWKVDNSRMNGVIAHELQDVVPYAVTGEKDAEQMQSVDYSKLVPVMIQAIQELKAEIEILKN